MLVLSRRRDEKIVIGGGIVITIVEVRGDKVRLGIEAPADVPVHRSEVYEAIQRENRRAATIDGSSQGASSGKEETGRQAKPQD